MSNKVNKNWTFPSSYRIEGSLPSKPVYCLCYDARTLLVFWKLKGVKVLPLQGPSKMHTLTNFSTIL